MVQLQVAKWFVDVLMGIAFLICFITGILKYRLFMQLFGLTHVPLPMAPITDIHDQSGIILGVLVGIHLVLNRRWICAMTRKVITGQR
jgi:hypothetical protein